MLSKIVWIVIAGMNLIAFALMGIDKHKAKAGKWRIKEVTLFLVKALFGGLGGTLGMYVFRHKTKHWYFKIGFPVLLIIQIILLCIGINVLS